MSKKGRIGAGARVALAAGFASLLASASPARAQEGGRLRVGVERMFGFTYNALTSSSESTTGGVTTTRESTTTWTAFNVFGSGFSAVTPALLVLNPLQAPRLGIDYELPSHLTLGGAIFFSWNSVRDADGDGYSAVGFGLAPRVGYSLRLTERLSFWPRAGVSFSYVGTSPRDAGTTSLTTRATYVPLWVNVEPMLTLAATQSFLFTFGLLLDIPLVGTVSSTSRTTVGGVVTERTTESTLTQFVFAAQFGLMGRF